MKLVFSTNSKINFVKPSSPPIGGFYPNATLQKNATSSVFSQRTLDVEKYIRFNNMMELVKTTGQPCGSCGGR
jgi:hypothetical protein